MGFHCRRVLNGAWLPAANILVVICILCWPLAAHAVEQSLTATGSTLMLPLLQSWAKGYSDTRHVALAAAGTDSGAGISAAIDGSAQIGTSDAYMSDRELADHPGILNIPLVISAQTINYNLPDTTARLRLSGPVLAGIYQGTIRNWRDPAVAALNPGVALPDRPIVPIRRSDASGDTFIFRQFLSFSTPDWEEGPGFGTSLDWPNVTGMVTATGNDGMVKALAQTPYGVAYIGGSYADAVSAAKLGTAELKNDAGTFVLPTPDTVTSAASMLTPRTPSDERLTLAFAPGAQSYPLINYEYAMVREKQPDAGKAAALRDFLIWALTPGQGTDPTYLDRLHFIALPIAIRALSESQIAKIH